MALIGICGFIGTGKGTAADYLVTKYSYKKDSFASSLKDACAYIFDWPRHMLEGDTVESREWRESVDQWWTKQLNIPDFTPRLALQLIGTDSLRNHFHQGIWFLTIQNRIRKNPSHNVVISDVRFSNEIDFIRNNGGTLISVSRGDTPVWYEVAVAANKNVDWAVNLMNTDYAHIHPSEWAWVGTKFDYKITNDSDISSLTLQLDNLILKIR